MCQGMSREMDAMNRAVLAVARGLVHGGSLRDADLSQLEVAIRCYDPCLSCSTHAVGRMPLEVTLVTPDGAVRERHLVGDARR